MSLQNPDIIQAMGRQISGGAAAFAVGASVANTGVGVYAITLAEALDSAEGGILVTLDGAAAAADFTVNVEDTSDTVKTVSITAAGVPTDAGFFWMAVKAPAGT
jgi:hypothetical protein